MRQAIVTNRMNRHRLHKKPVITAVFALAFATIFTAISPSQTFAATPPDSCFQRLNSWITAYYNNEGNNSANPACPKDVDIPSTIGGVTITTIGSAAFQNKQLTSVTIPNTVVTILDRAFQGNLLTTVVIPNSVLALNSYIFADNQLTSVTLLNSPLDIWQGAFANNQLTSITIPNSVTAIYGFAFFNNQLTSVTIPSSVTSMSPSSFAFNQLTSVTINGTPTLSNIPFLGNDADLTTLTGIPRTVPPGSGAQAAYMNSAASLVPVYMPNGSGSAMSQIAFSTINNAQLGITSTTAIKGGQIINPAQLTVQYKDTNGNTIAPSVTEVGAGLGDYKLSTFFGVHPGDELTTATVNLSGYYYFDGTSVSKTAPTITGYTLTSSSTQTIELDVGANTMTFVYKANSDSDSDGSGSADDNTETPAAPNTGLRTSIVSNPVVTVSGLVLIGAVVIVLRRRFVR